MRGRWLLAWSAGSFWVGILVEGLGRRGPSASVAVALLVTGVLGVVAIAFAQAGLRWAPLTAVVVSFALLGAGWSGLREAGVRASALAALLGRSVRLQGSVGSDPTEGRFGWAASMDVGWVLEGWDGTGSVSRVRGSVWLEGHGTPPLVHAGDRLSVTGVLRAARGDFATYLRHRGYAGIVATGEVRRLGPSASPVRRLTDSLRSGLASSAGRVLPPEQAGLLLGLALGDTSRLDAEVEEDFRATGLSHLTAVSGENVAMFLAPILGLLTWMGLGRVARLLIGLAAVGFFVLLTRAEPSVLRAAMMTGLTMLGVFLGRPRSPTAILGGAVLFLLAVNPSLVYAIGFQLSVAATAGMALLSAPLAERLRSLPRWLALSAATTLGAQAGVTPLLLFHFGAVPTVTLPANLLAFAAVGPAMLLGLTAAGLGLIARPVGMAAAQLARIPLVYLEGLADRLARSPLPSITSSGGQAPLLVLQAAGVGAAAWWLRSRRQLPRQVALISVAAIPLVVWLHALGSGPPSALTITFFSVGWGDASLIRSPGGATVLIDGGPDPDMVARKLSALGVRRLDLVVATHPHADHIDGLPFVLERVPTSLVIDPGCRTPSSSYERFLQAVSAAGVPFRHPRPGQSIRVGDLRFRVLAPERCFHGTRSDPNNDSLVLQLAHRGRVVLFGGDAEQPSQADLLNHRPALLAAPLVKWPHHGGNTNLDAFFQAARPRVAIVSTGPNIYGDPSPVVLAKLVHHGIRVYRTDVQGDVTVTLEGGSLLLQSADG